MAAVLLLIKIVLLKKSMDEIHEEFTSRLSTDTNALIALSSRDKHARRLASEINSQLRLLRRERIQYQKGDQELKEAITNISHDLRTPLTAICGYLDLMEEEQKSQEVRRYLDCITDRVDALKQLAEELFSYSLAVSQPDLGDFESICLRAALEESVAANYSLFVMRGIVPEINLPETPVIRHLNKAALQRVLSNVLGNALKYSDGDLEIHLSETGLIEFSNTASGLDEVQTGKLFNRFYTVNDARSSNGLGLAISRTFVERMGGQMYARYNDAN